MDDKMRPGMLHTLLDVAARTWPQSVAVQSAASDAKWSYAELETRSHRFARWLAMKGVRSGDRVAVVAANCLELVALIFGASRLGVSFVVIDPRTKSFHLRHVLQDADPRIVLVDPTSRAVVTEATQIGTYELTIPSGHADPWVAPLESDRTACLIYTSGSTALPKAVVETHAQMMFAAAAVADRLMYRADDRVLCCLPLSFDYGLYQVLLSTMAGATLVLGSERDAGPEILQRLAAHEVTVFPVVPLLAVNVIQLANRRPTPLPHLRLITNTGAVLTESVIARLRHHFPAAAVVLMFGLTECKRVSVLEPNGDRERPGSVGRALRGTVCRVVDESGVELSRGHVGELVVQGDHVMSGYWQSPELTAQRFRVLSDGRRELWTGDFCRMDREGYLYFAGRRDDVYKQRGTRISALEVEAAAADVPAVEEAAVLVPIGDEGAHLVVTGDLTAEALIVALGDRLPIFKLPSRCTVVDRLPRSPNGKVDKHSLQEMVNR